MKPSLLFLFLLFAFQSVAQNRTILIFDLENGRVDSIKNIQYDTAIQSDRTVYNLGTYNSQIETLEQVPPVNNIYPNSHFTHKKKAAADYNLDKYPIRTSVKMFFKKNDTLTDLCSGSMISRRHVLTAAHCVSWVSSDTLLYDSIYVCPVFDNGNINNSFPCSWVRKISIFKGWNLNGDDFALLQLKEPIGDLTGWISIGFNAVDSSLANGIFYKFSYPSRTIPSIDSTEYNGDTLYYNYGKADILSNNLIGVNHASGIPGESGSSIIQVENDQNYTSYGVLSFSGNLMHSRLNNWSYYALEHIIHSDLAYNTGEELSEENVSIFPNPADDKIWIRHTGTIAVSGLVILDIFGKQVLSKPINDINSAVDLKKVPRGIYFVVLKTSRLQISRKLIIQ